MDTIKRATQNVTMLFCIAILLFFGYACAQIVNLTIDGWRLTDSIYQISLVGFWATLALTRALFAAAWIALTWGTISLGQRNGFFWFKQNRDYSSYSREEPNRDLSGWIVGLTVAVILTVMIAELAIRLSTGTPMPYPSSISIHTATPIQ